MGTSGPALNILIKLMSMVSLTIAPLLKEEQQVTLAVEGPKTEEFGNDDWENWYWGMIPLGIFVLASAVLMFKKILTWEDPLEAASKGAKAFRSSDVPNPEDKPAAQKDENSPPI